MRQTPDEIQAIGKPRSIQILPPVSSHQWKQEGQYHFHDTNSQPSYSEATMSGKSWSAKCLIIFQDPNMDMVGTTRLHKKRYHHKPIHGINLTQKDMDTQGRAMDTFQCLNH